MYIQLNGQVIYYERTGEGSPIILTHGNGDTHKIFDNLIPELSKKHTVYALDTRGHGESATAEEYHYNDMAADIAAFVYALELEKPAFLGFSDGGITGLIAASMHPSLFSRMVICGANLSPKGLKFSERFSFRLQYMKHKDKLLALMLKEPHISKYDLSIISIPTLVVAGSKDIVKKKETKRIAKYLPNATLRILPGENHSSYVVHSAKLAPLLAGFLR